MCTTCGCGHPDQVRIGELPHVHNDSNEQHETKLPNFSHSSFRMPDSPQQDETQQRLLKVEQDISLETKVKKEIGMYLIYQKEEIL